MNISASEEKLIPKKHLSTPMTDVMLLWDTPILFEKLFQEHDIKCTRVLSNAIGTPFLPPCKCLMIPTGFANTAYTKIISGIERNKDTIEEFVKKGGIVAVFGPMISEHDYEWLPMDLKYTQKHETVNIHIVEEHGAQSIIQDIDQAVECDGYFSETKEKVLIENSYGKPVMVAKQLGEGMIIATTIHEFPSPEFLKWLCSGKKKIKLSIYKKT